MNTKLTPEDVLGKILDCFYDAHCNDIDLGGKADEAVAKEYCRSLVAQAFIELDTDIESPTKDSLIKVINWLAEFSGNFRTKEIIMGHYEEIMKSINQLSQ